MRWLFVLFIGIHGLIHFMGFAKAYGLAELPQLAQPVSRGMGIVWLGAGTVLLLAAVLFISAPRYWWVVGLVGVLLSQAAILTSWSDARFGTVANLLLLGLIAYGFASQGPGSFSSEYRLEVKRRETQSPPVPLVTEADLSSLPESVRRYLRVTGSVGQPRVRDFRARWQGRIRAGPDDPWMGFTAQQRNFLDEPARFFLMDARRAGLPVDVYHAFRLGSASMRVKLLSLFPMVDARGPELDRAETVTFFNDLCLLAPGALIDPDIAWETLGDNRVRARYTVGANTIRADLLFDSEGKLVDFVSEDRAAVTPEEEGFVRGRWSTPVREYRRFGERRVMTRGEGRWHLEGGAFAYIELELLDLEVNGAR